MSFSASIANLSWCGSGYPSWRSFEKSSCNPELAQKKILDRIVKSNQATEYGKKYNFNQINKYSDYRTLVPLVAYDDIQDYILRIAMGEKNVLTIDQVTLLEPTGGSSAGIKYIPYTKNLAEEFNCGIQAWIYNLFTSVPALMGGRAYWSISPLNEYPEIFGAKIPVGFKDDREYLSNIGKLSINRILAVPGSISQIRDIAAHRYVTLFYLLKTRDLRLISVWNPTFLSLLLSCLDTHWDSLVSDIESGKISAVDNIPDEILDQLNDTIVADRNRAVELKTIRSDNLSAIWPGLKLISCWMDGASEVYARKLQADYFPDIDFQGKGLLATEAFISFPLYGVEGAVLAVDSHFYEFLPVDSAGVPDAENPVLASDLAIGKRYAVVVTTGGGLYRYQLHDIIEVTGFYNRLPCFRFKTKTDHFSDLFGEKLSENFVSDSLASIFSELKFEPVFMMLAPEQSGNNFHYCLYLEPGVSDNGKYQSIAAELETRLCRNYHYDYCRKLAQLGPVSVTLVAAGAATKYLEVCRQRGQKLGDIKPAVLNKYQGWGKVFAEQ